MFFGLPDIIFAKVKIKDLPPIYKKWLIEEGIKNELGNDIMDNNKKNHE